jgi:hypothetical protein
LPCWHRHYFLGIVTGRDLAQTCHHLLKPVAMRCRVLGYHARDLAGASTSWRLNLLFFAAAAGAWLLTINRATGWTVFPKARAFISLNKQILLKTSSSGCFLYESSPRIPTGAASTDWIRGPVVTNGIRAVWAQRYYN